LPSSEVGEVRDVAPARLAPAGGKRIARRVPTGGTTVHPSAARHEPEVKANECMKPRPLYVFRLLKPKREYSLNL
jgi:hypothetical protein